MNTTKTAIKNLAGLAIVIMTATIIGSMSMHTLLGAALIAILFSGRE